MARRRDVVLLDLLGVLPGLAPPDREDLVDLACVVAPMRGDHRDDLGQRRRPAPVDRPLGIEVGARVHGREPSFVAGLEPRKDLLDVLVRRLHLISKPAGPVRVVPMAWFLVEGVGVVDGRPAGGVFRQAEDRPVTAGSLQYLLEGEAADVVDEHPMCFLERRERKPVLGPHLPMMPRDAETFERTP